MLRACFLLLVSICVYPAVLAAEQPPPAALIDKVVARAHQDESDIKAGREIVATEHSVVE
jgi:hypothetical protein